ncbi:hypothetical protein [Chondromyces crocatus]|uniref:Uncharacterized protein n=1 Tax=Chondromyces crocatus TaxID=52 RepID=A0A0K1EGZ0_CHOCO|nr:hypothetical protein [Chondromyces crocatus]AKT40126.1 uncharacterized protein CMC5_042790 [Chondromyces crocatus]
MDFESSPVRLTTPARSPLRWFALAGVLTAVAAPSGVVHAEPPPTTAPALVEVPPTLPPELSAPLPAPPPVAPDASTSGVSVTEPIVTDAAPLDRESFTAAGREDAELLLQAPRTPDDGPRRALMMVTGGLAITGLALGGLFGGMAISKWDEVETLAQKGCRNPARFTGCTQGVADAEIEASSFATISTFGFLAGGLALAGTTLLWLTGPPRPRARLTVQISPVIAPGNTTGALLQGTF